MYRIPLTKPYLAPGIAQRIQKTLESGFWTEGPVVKELEACFKSYIGCDHAVAATSCTTGLEMALRALNIGTGDEVIIPDYTHPATAFVVLLVGATPVIVDIDPDTLNIDCRAVEKAITPATKAVIPVSIFGNPLDWSMLGKIKDKYSLFIVEDAACSIGSGYKGIKTGCRADITVFSLHPRKTVAVGEGGMITTNSSRIYKWIKSYKNFGSKYLPDRDLPSFVSPGTNYKLSDIAASIGIEQMKAVDTLIARRREQAQIYMDLLENIDQIDFQKKPLGGCHAYQSFCIQVNNRDFLKQEMRNLGIEVQIGTFALHREKAFEKASGTVIPVNPENSLRAFHQNLVLPMYHEMTLADQKTVVEALADLIGEEAT